LYFLRFDDGVSQTHLLNNVFRKCPLPIPPTEAEQGAIAAILADMDEGITALEAKIAKARQIKQGMMQELLTGKIRLI
jgi:type I restriction enzyme, S subunit